MDRRRHTRYDVCAFVLFTWKDKFGRQCEGHGMSRDLSLGGVFVLTEMCPPCGSSVDMTLRFRTGPSDSGILIKMTGPVLRVDQAQEPETTTGFATRSANLALLQERLKGARRRTVLEVAIPANPQAKDTPEESTRKDKGKGS